MNWLGTKTVLRLLCLDKEEIDEKQIANLADIACQAIEDYTGDYFGPDQTFTDITKGGGRSLVVSGTIKSIVSITSLSFGTVYDESTYILIPDSGIIRKKQFLGNNFTWGNDLELFEVISIKGITEVPSNVEMAGAKIIQNLMFNNSFSSERDGDYSYSRNPGSYTDGLITPEIAELLRYARKDIIIV